MQPHSMGSIHEKRRRNGRGSQLPQLLLQSPPDFQTWAQAHSQAWYVLGWGHSELREVKVARIHRQEIAERRLRSARLLRMCPGEQTYAHGTLGWEKQGPGRENDHTSRRMRTFAGPPDRMKSPPDKELLLKKKSTT